MSFESNSDSVMLRGGPMDGWYVRSDAPALEPEWGIEFGGRYERIEPDEAGIAQAEWRAT